MSDAQELDPRVKGFERAMKFGGLAVVTVAASAVVIASAGSVIVAGLTAVGALAIVNAVPVFARWAALQRQRGLTALAEVFSEQTIREDERTEEARVQEQQRLYRTQEAEFRNVIDELRQNIASATPDEQQLLQGQIDELENVLSDTWSAIERKVADLVELKRVNGIYISLHRAAKVMKRGQDLQRNAEEIQRIETARQAIKTRMREALAGQRLEAMNAPLKAKLSAASVAQIASPLNRPSIGMATPEVVPSQVKEAQRVPHSR